MSTPHEPSSTAIRSRRMASSRVRASCISVPCFSLERPAPVTARGLFRRLVSRSPSCLSKLSGALSLAVALTRGVLLHEELRRTQRPGVLDQVTHLGGVDRVEADVHPVEAHVGFARQRELLRLRLDQSSTPLLRKPEAHGRAVLREREKDDLPNAELDPPAHESLARTRQRPGQLLHVSDSDGHLPRTVRPAATHTPRNSWSDPGCHESVTVDPQPAARRSASALSTQTALASAGARHLFLGVLEALLDLPAVGAGLAALDELELCLRRLQLLPRARVVDLACEHGVVDQRDCAGLLHLEEARPRRELLHLPVPFDVHARRTGAQRCDQRRVRGQDADGTGCAGDYDHLGFALERRPLRSHERDVELLPAVRHRYETPAGSASRSAATSSSDAS